MNQADLYTLVSTTLNRPCGCHAIDQGLSHGNTCPDNGTWHTWRRRNAQGGFCARLAVAFVGIDGGEQSGIFKVNYASAAQAKNIVYAARNQGIPGVELDIDNDIRVQFNTAGIAAGQYDFFYIASIRAGVNEAHRRQTA